MKNVKTHHTTRTIGEAQGYLPLHVADDQYPDGTKAMVTFWKPSDEELKTLTEGRFLRLIILGTGHPPVSLDVDERTLTELSDKVN